MTSVHPQLITVFQTPIPDVYSYFMPTTSNPQTTQNSLRAGLPTPMDQARTLHSSESSLPHASIEEVVETLDSPIQLCDPDHVPEPEVLTDGQRTLTGTPARNPSSSTVSPPGTTSNVDLASAMALLAQSIAKSNSTPVSTAPSSGSKL